jgi:hypothetical protein
MPRIGDSMIRLFLRICKDFDDDDIDRAALRAPDVDAARLRCSRCGAVGQMTGHGSYGRHFVFLDGDVMTDELITVTRVRCDSCRATHALLPLAAIPYRPFSIRLVARLIFEWLECLFPSIEALCEHYGIDVNTFYRYRRHYESCVRIARGMLYGKDRVRAVAHEMCRGDASRLDCILAAFFDETGMSFCQSRGP